MVARGDEQSNPTITARGREIRQKINPTMPAFPIVWLILMYERKQIVVRTASMTD